MPRYESNEIRAERARIHEDMKRILDTAEAAERDLTAEETQEFDRLEERFGALDRDLRRVEVVEGFTPAAVEPTNDAEDRTAEVATEQSEAFSRALRGATDAEVRAALSTSNANGGYTVPQTWAASLVEKIEDLSPVRALAEVITTTGGGQINYPRVASAGMSAALRAEANPYTESEDTFETVPLNAYDVGALVKVSKELLADSAFDIDALIQRRGSQAIALKEGAYFATGTGSGQPEGVTVGATVGKTTASNSAIVPDELVDVFHSVPASYRRNASWVLNDATIAAIRKVKSGISGDLTYIWQPGLQAGQPDLLLGKPVYADPNVDTIASDKVVAVFGDFRAGVVVRDVAETTVQVLVEQYAVNGQVGYIVSRRTDCAVVDNNAIRSLRMKV